MLYNCILHCLIWIKLSMLDKTTHLNTMICQYSAIFIVASTGHEKLLYITMSHALRNSLHKIILNDIEICSGHTEDLCDKMVWKAFVFSQCSHFEYFAVTNEIVFEGEGISAISLNLPKLSHMSNIDIWFTFQKWAWPNDCVALSTKSQLSSHHIAFHLDVRNSVGRCIMPRHRKKYPGAMT